MAPYFLAQLIAVQTGQIDIKNIEIEGVGLEEFLAYQPEIPNYNWLIVWVKPFLQRLCYLFFILNQ